ncbi:hypothetical protein COY26_01355 [Candidatus Woesearchaeota archaeon CG_4_10_14_0_2_um_filter_33_10]|nr:MAG: hypothetical protein COY26_01355 [Candidatus Woesearchaeota archaeon CG_4_10_14_0_2_um_filter_33_10]
MKQRPLIALITAIILISVIIGLTLVSAETPKVNINLNYGNSTIFDSDKDGIEIDNSVISFTVKDTEFNWHVNKRNLCTKWEIFSIEDNKITVTCHGSELCCNFIGLKPAMQNWDDNLYLTYGEYGTSLNNKISARVIYIDYNLDIEKPYSRIYYSDYDYLYAVFLDKDYFSGKSISSKDYETIEKLEKIKIKNQLAKITLTDENENPVSDNLENKNLKLNLFINKEENNDYKIFSTANNEELVTIKNFNGKNINWKRLEGISIEKDNPALKNSLRKKGIISREIISVSGVNEAIEGNYNGYLKINTNGIFYNKVFHCSENLVCNELNECNGKNENCYLKNENNIEVYIPHFSSVVIALDTSDINLTIISPDNTTALESGENIYLNFTTNLTVSANYSFDRKEGESLGTGIEFTDLLKGELQHNTLQNGIHNITINLWDDNSSIAQHNHSFKVEDIYPPNISIKHNGINLNNSEIHNTLITIISDEYANINYKLNNDGYSISEDIGSDKTIDIHLDLEVGTNTLIVNVTDFHCNSRLFSVEFNFTTCSDGIKNQGEKDVDCGGPCDDCVTFNVSTDKTNYAFEEEVMVRISSRAYSVINLTLLKSGSVMGTDIVNNPAISLPLNMISPLDYLITYSHEPGSYILNATLYYINNMNVTENKIVTFTIEPPQLNVNINANDTTINEGDTVKFTSTVTGYTGTLSYKWDFGNDGSIESTSTEVTKTYNNNGTYTVNLTVTDNTYSASDLETIIVKKLFNVTITVKNDSGNIVTDADVEFNNIHKNASDDGKASFLVNSGTYELRVKKSSYITYYNNSVEINSNKDIELKLKYDENDYENPKITLITPDQNQKISTDSVKITYKVEDDSEVNCSLQLNEYLNSWVEKGTHENPEKNKENSFTLLGLNSGEYKYKVKCTDRYGNIGFSDIRIFYAEINSLSSSAGTAEMTKQDEDINSIIDKINGLLTEFEKLDKEEREVFETLEIQKKLDNAKTELSRFKRDLNNLIWRNLNETELKEAEIDIYDQIENLKDEIPTSLSVIDSTEFVAYPKDEDIENITITYLNSKNSKYSKKQEKSFIEGIKELQSLLTVTTKAKVVEISYLSNKKEKITLIEKELKINESSNGLSLVEYIPKEIAKDTSEIEFLFDYETILNDPLISINIKGLDKFAYYLRKEIKLEDIKKTKSVLITGGEIPKGNQITGFGILTNLKSGFISSDNTRILIEVLIIIILSLVYIGYSIKGTKTKYYFGDRKSLKNLKEIKRFIESAKSELDNHNYHEAKSFYRNINLIFKNLPQDMKKEVYKNIVTLSHKLDLFYINKLLDRAEFSIQNKNKEVAISAYNEITGLYKRVPLEYKSLVLEKCNKLRQSLSGKNVN